MSSITVSQTKILYHSGVQFRWILYFSSKTQQTTVKRNQKLSKHSRTTPQPSPLLLRLRYVTSAACSKSFSQ